MEKQSVFERLAEKFSGCQVEIRRGKNCFDWDKSDEMLTAGKALFAKISSKEIGFGDTPDWFTKEPKGWAIDSTGRDRQFCSWDLYWLSAIKWLAENKPDSGITFPGSIGRIKPGEHLCSKEGVTGLLITLLHLRNENLKRAWLGLAKASEDACSYLVRILSDKLADTGRNAAPAKIINIGNFKGVLGDVQAENVQTGDYSSIHKQTITAEKKKGIFIRLLKIIGAIVGFLVALLGILHYLGWLEPVKALISKILGSK